MSALTPRLSAAFAAKLAAGSTVPTGPGGPDPLALRNLAKLLAAHAPHDGCVALRLPGIYAIRRSCTTPEPVHATQGPALCIVAQGSKIAMLGREVFTYDAARMLVFSVDLPFAGQVIRASHAEPFLGCKLDLDPFKVAELALRVFPDGAPPPSSNRGLYVGQATNAIVNAVTRLVELMAEPADAALLAPLVVEEILIRLLRSPIGNRVAQIGQTDSGVHRVARAVS
jgi:hypothetical protein